MIEHDKNRSIASIQETIGAYFQGYLKAEPETLAQAFHVSARLFCTEGGRLETTELADWLKNLRERQKKGDIRQAEASIDSIDVSGDAAVARTTLVFKAFRFTDYLSLLLIDGNWKVINKIYTVHKFSQEAQ